MATQTRPRLVRRNNPIYGYLFKEIIPKLVSESLSKSNNHIGIHRVTHFRLFEPKALAGEWMTNDYEGELDKIETIYSVEKNEIF